VKPPFTTSVKALVATGVTIEQRSHALGADEYAVAAPGRARSRKVEINKALCGSLLTDAGECNDVRGRV